MSFIKDKDSIREIAEQKRLLEYLVFDKDFAKKFEADRKKTLESIGLGDLDTEHAASLYKEFINKKTLMRESVRAAGEPSNPQFAKWRNRQIGRCTMMFSKEQSDSLVHLPILFELSKGCSIGCKFCGLNSGPLKTVFMATEENIKLWADVMDAAVKLIGPAVGEGICYYGTEPLDNPDYGYFSQDWFERFGKYPQITTAAALRNVEKTRELLKQLDPFKETIFRFSVRSLDEFTTIAREFTPEELLMVELLPQFEEAPGNALAKVGRNATENEYSGTISCVSGFKVNMCDRSISLITPVEASERFPLGQIELKKVIFTDGEDFERKLETMISGMKTILSPNEKLSLYDYLYYNIEINTCKVYNKYGVGYQFDFPDYSDLIQKLFDSLNSGLYTRREIVEKLEIKNAEGWDSLAFHSIINNMWNRGLIVDSQLYE